MGGVFVGSIVPNNKGLIYAPRVLPAFYVLISGGAGGGMYVGGGALSAGGGRCVCNVSILPTYTYSTLLIYTSTVLALFHMFEPLNW